MEPPNQRFIVLPREGLFSGGGPAFDVLSRFPVVHSTQSPIGMRLANGVDAGPRHRQRRGERPETHRGRRPTNPASLQQPAFADPGGTAGGVPPTGALRPTVRRRHERHRRRTFAGHHRMPRRGQRAARARRAGGRVHRLRGARRCRLRDGRQRSGPAGTGVDDDRTDLRVPARRLLGGVRDGHRRRRSDSAIAHAGGSFLRRRGSPLLPELEPGSADRRQHRNHRHRLRAACGPEHRGWREHRDG